MEQLAHALRRSVKLSILDAGAALVVAVAESPETYSVTTQVGRRFPLHAGAASKVLAAFADDAVRASLFAAPLPRFTPATIVDRARLRRDLATVRQRGYATDVGEFAPAIKAIAAPIFGPEGSCVAAVSIPYVGTLRATAERAIRAAVVRAAEDLSRSLGGR
jgi:DNA-binding IclR family transcriptional regulator